MVFESPQPDEDKERFPATLDLHLVSSAPLRCQICPFWRTASLRPRGAWLGVLGSALLPVQQVDSFVFFRQSGVVRKLDQLKSLNLQAHSFSG